MVRPVRSGKVSLLLPGVLGAGRLKPVAEVAVAGQLPLAQPCQLRDGPMENPD